ncbi:MAG TPA: glycosyltransferase family 1 protein [Burkholderiaceae bacterium]|nr:glycosyltransferase family 1 protein [Burkholderiaceae bacterium]
MKLITVTDAWHPQVNGVVRTIEATNREIERAGHTTDVISPQAFGSVPCPGYGEIRLSLAPYRSLARLLDSALAGHHEIAIHVATEGPLGHAARRYCRVRQLPYSTAYHTRFPQYLKAMFGVPAPWTYGFLRHFHGPADVVMAPTPAVERELREHGLDNVALWTRGVDIEMFTPRDPLIADAPHPVFLNVGRVSVEKNIQAFLALDLPGTKIVAGVGPALETLKLRFPEVRFVGVLDAVNLARLYSSADVFVFPSRTDTFGLVMLEALACGTPVAAFPVQGPVDVVGESSVAVLDEDLRKAALNALRIDRASCRAYAERHSWRAATVQFLALQHPFAPASLADAAPGSAH